MKLIAAPLALLFAVSVMHAQAPAPAAAPTTKPAAKTITPAAQTTPAKIEVAPKAGVAAKTEVTAKAGVAAKTELAPKAGATITKDGKKEQEKEPIIPGTNIARPNGTWLGLEVVNGNFKLSFYDKKKKAMAPDVTRVTARWPNPRAPGDNRTVLNVSGNALVGAKPVIPPYNFNVFLTLLVGDGDDAKAVENYTVAFRG